MPRSLAQGAKGTLFRIWLSYQGSGLFFLLDWSLKTNIHGSSCFLTMKRQLIPKPVFKDLRHEAHPAVAASVRGMATSSAFGGQHHKRGLLPDVMYQGAAGRTLPVIPQRMQTPGKTNTMLRWPSGCHLARQRSWRLCQPGLSNCPQ